MRQFDIVLSEAIEDEAKAPAGYYEMATDVLRQLEDAERGIDALKMQIQHLTEQIGTSLGNEIRKRQPKLTVSLTGGKCNCGYRSREMICEPDFQSGTWKIDGSPFARQFSRVYPHLMKISDDVNPLAHAISDFFNNRYKTLGDHKPGNPGPAIRHHQDSSTRGAGHYA